MRIGVIGSGEVGRSLAMGFFGRGDDVMIGTRDPAKLEAWRSESAPAVRVGSFAEVAAFGELIAIATLGSGTEAAIDLAGRENFAGKPVVDVTNPLVFEQGRPPGLSIGLTDSAGERIQRFLPDAHVVKAFNTVGNTLFVNPQLPHGSPTMFYCGNDASAKSTVRQIISDFGWEPADIGGIESARYLEPLAMVWILYGAGSGTWNHAFKLLHE